MNLKTDFKDDVFQGNRKYIQIKNEDGTVTFQDATQYEQEGDYFGAAELNQIAGEVNNKANKTDIPNIPTSLPANGGNADTVNGKTVAVNVPAGAKFTDTVYTHPTTHPTSILANGALPIGVTAAGSATDYGTSRLRNIHAGTADLIPNSSGLTSGYIYIVYE